MDKPAASRWHPYPAERPPWPPPPREVGDPEPPYLVRYTHPAYGYAVYTVDNWIGDTWFCIIGVTHWAVIEPPEEDR